MKKELTCLTNEKKKLRFLWLIGVVVSAFMGVLSSIWVIKSSIISMATNPNFSQEMIAQMQKATIIGSVFGYLIVFGFLYSLFHCAYKKHGVKFLTVYMVIIAVTSAYSCWWLFFGNHNLPTFFMAVQVLSLIIGLGNFTFSFYLRKINKKIQQANFN